MKNHYAKTIVENRQIPGILIQKFLMSSILLVSLNARDAQYLKKAVVSDVKTPSAGRRASFLSKNPFRARSSPRADSRLLEGSRGVVYRACKRYQRHLAAYYYARDASRCDVAFAASRAHVNGAQTELLYVSPFKRSQRDIRELARR